MKCNTVLVAKVFIWGALKIYFVKGQSTWPIAKKKKKKKLSVKLSNQVL
jgi:hypothetical protein